MRDPNLKRLRVQNVGPISDADVEIGDMTLLIGPQATGKSIFLQLLKLLIDRDHIHETMRSTSMSRTTRKEEFFRHYLGEGMDTVWGGESRIYLGKSKKPTDLAKFRKPSRTQTQTAEQLFYIPAQRVICLKDGLTRTFTDFRTSDPYIIKSFSQTIHAIMKDEFGNSDDIFPKSNRLLQTLREPLIQHVFGGYVLKKDLGSDSERLVLQREADTVLPYLVWSAGQREFVPLLLGLYWLLPPGASPTRHALKYVVIEEPENGLHPNAIRAVLGLMFELLNRNYKILIATHSPYILDVIWAIKTAQDVGGFAKDILRILHLPTNNRTRSIAESALRAKFNTYYFQRNLPAEDISELNLDSSNKSENGWGGLGEFSGDVSNAVANMVTRT